MHSRESYTGSDSAEEKAFAIVPALLHLVTIAEPSVRPSVLLTVRRWDLLSSTDPEVLSEELETLVLELFAQQEMQFMSRQKS